MSPLIRVGNGASCSKRGALASTSSHNSRMASRPLAAWLTDKDQEVAAFKAQGPFPSVVAAQPDPALATATGVSAFFNAAPISAILSKRAEGIKAQFKGPDDSTIQDQVFGPSAIALDQGKSGTQAWADAMKLLDQLVVNK